MKTENICSRSLVIALNSPKPGFFTDEVAFENNKSNLHVVHAAAIA